jgi:hypothetical protein
MHIGANNLRQRGALLNNAIATVKICHLAEFRHQLGPWSPSVAGVQTAYLTISTDTSRDV